ncbi:TetR/AcrR family transcriptional regulator C-terminal domain-containing protein [Saccharopolyspora sp. WRP15-2]|uniref:TetR/AcrR family transcriptional regulator C-terminal domain-containing protein n=1 Tax=Saccharopolyspora oryzae TaxID=2997343 RepID=A0ABT4UYZ4_9PSEU|nr:TetR/AcrR family transcriptional regulator C-terminal domain-containing protein [Saccharopolyspora oryzae]MDA3626793.1 TetR/AcrR family transcriptional regulator C-terminal domain-containing protein [Saccharopolyspora oryzae]
MSLDQITAAAIEIADAEGLAGVRMSSVAARLDVSTMALYGYVGGKDDLLTAMADAATPEPPEPGGVPWREYLTTWTRANRDVLTNHSWLLSSSPTIPPTGPRALRWLDRVLTALDGTGLDAGEGINIATTLSGYARSSAALALGLHGPVDEAASPGPAGYAETLAEVLDDRGHPALFAAVHAGAFGQAEQWVDDADFTFGLDLLLDGIQALITRRERGR